MSAFIISLVTFSNESFALSGACSNHGGVSCSSGPDTDGSVICSDGWTDSSVNFWQTQECSQILCNEQIILKNALIKKADSEGLLDIGTSKLCEAAGLNSYSSLSTCLALRQQELDSVYKSIDVTVNENRYLCYSDTASSKTGGGGGSGGGSSSSDNRPDYNNADLNNDNFSDVASDHPYAKEIHYLKNKNIVEGYSDGNYMPDSNINRAELLKIIISTKFGNVDDSYTEKCFKDIDPDEWYAKYVCFGKEYNIVSGYDDETFKPNQNITIAEAMKITLSAYGETFDTDPWYKGYMEHFNDNVESLSSNRFCATGCLPELETISRGKMAYLIERVATNAY